MNIVRRVEKALDELRPFCCGYEYIVGAAFGVVVVTRVEYTGARKTWYIPADDIDRVKNLAVYVNSFIGARPNVRSAFR